MYYCSKINKEIYIDVEWYFFLESAYMIMYLAYQIMFGLL